MNCPKINEFSLTYRIYVHHHHVSFRLRFTCSFVLANECDSSDAPDLVPTARVAVRDYVTSIWQL